MDVLYTKALGDSALLVYCGEEINEQTYRRVQALCQAVQQQPFHGFIECVPAYTNVCIHYDVYAVFRAYKEIPIIAVERYIEALAKSIVLATSSERIIEIPVLYGGEHGPDLAYVADYHQLTEQEVIRRHSERELLVHMLGFAPGFAFIGGMDPSIATPRRTTPRARISIGSVGIAGEQTGIYSCETPGGWNIIGRTYVPLFLPEQNPPTLLRAGDRIRFIASGGIV